MRQCGKYGAGLGALALVLGMGCSGKDKSPTMYVAEQDNSGRNVLIRVIDDLKAHYENSSDKKQVSLIEMTGLDGKMAKGGMTYDTAGNCLYLVSEAGKVVRLDGASLEKGGTVSPSFSFDILNNKTSNTNKVKLHNDSIFSQMSFANGKLYVAENYSQGARVWECTPPRNSNEKCHVHLITVDGEDQVSEKHSHCSGVACASSEKIFAYFGASLKVQNSSAYIRSSSNLLKDGSVIKAFEADSNAIPCVNTGIYGTLASDTANNLLYFSFGSEGKVGRFEFSQFSGTESISTPTSLASSPSGITVLAHAGTEDWLAASSGSQVHLWRDARKSDSQSKSVYSGSNIRGIAFDGSR